jgi:hypothetical protein
MANHSILAEVEGFLKRNSMAASAFGRSAVNDWRFVRDIRAGRRVWPETEQRVRTFMRQYDSRAVEQVAA